MVSRIQRITLLAIGASILALAGTARGQSIVYPNFSNTSNLQLNGSTATPTTTDGTVLRLTSANPYQAGSAFSKTQIALTNSSFSTAFNFRITGSGGIGDENGAGADGFVFVIQPVANNVGSSGGGIGYQGIPNSLGIEFDTYNNGYSLGDQNNGNHIAVNTNGNLTDMFLTPISTPMNNGALWSAWVDYNGTTNDLEVRLSQNGVRPATALIQTNSINLSTLLGTNSAYVGFTSGTGAAWGNHDIVSWQFNDTYQPINQVGVPDGGATALLLGLGFGVLVLARRRQRA
ncbi:MAG TPA: L-type lectin-domain containing protein [Opitutaceae bacterium]|nr:L-type lectin-domain containing protein [Opitutaceae bacterium]